ncbi:MAG: amidohydrolase family protein, partial [Acidimicrobiales bacterium]|nr:amidohydrolase family protein [Acidimicrobiales bacterium]
MSASLVVVGTVLQAPTPDALEVLADVAVVVDAGGRITAILPAGSAEAAAACATAAEVVRLGPDLPLERWLFEYTFPLEARYADAAFAAAVWEHMVPCLLAHGTTTAVYFSSLHEDATALLAETCLRHGHIAASARSVERIRSLGSGLVQPILTPRFVPACTDDLLAGLGELAEAMGVLVQTHCSESDWEHGYVLDRYGRRDAEVLAGFGLLRQGTVLAHGNHLDDGDFGLIAGQDAGVAHCPLSNAHFANAVFPARRALHRGVRVGLGTDVAGGSHPGLLPQCVDAVTVSRILEDGVDHGLPAAERGVPGSRIDAVTAFHLATAGGASVLGADVGVLAPGRWFDALVVGLDRPGSPLHAWDGLDTDET